VLLRMMHVCTIPWEFNNARDRRLEDEYGLVGAPIC
jgi:hypothetical protein